MKRNFRLTQTRDFDHAKKEGKSKQQKFAVLVYKKNGMENSRSAVVASKAVGNAVTRNLVKRKMRACLADSWDQIKSGWDLIFYAKTAGSHASYKEWLIAIQRLLEHADLIIDKRN